MAYFTHPGIRPEVHQYLDACTNLLARKPVSHEQFMRASQLLQQKNGKFTDEELVLVQEMLRRISIQLAEAGKSKRIDGQRSLT